MAESCAEPVLRTYRKPTEEDRRKCRADFVVGRGNGPQIAVRYGLSYNTVRNWIISGKWSELRAKKDHVELCSLREGYLPSEIVPDKPETDVELLRGHLADTDQQLKLCTEAKDRAMLARARAELSEQLWVAIHGAKPGTQRPGRTKSRPVYAQPVPTEPVQPSPVVGLSPANDPLAPNG